MHTWDIARKNPRQQPFRSALAAIGLAVSVTDVAAFGLAQRDLSLRAILEGAIIAARIAVFGAGWPAVRCARLPIGDTISSH
ncbi:MAG: hypothetical protein IT427_12660 [Pirellulales bacterium]|jgi:hypothetical protein|nr:hypothetical protein [Pirellulales bacterium]